MHSSLGDYATEFTLGAKDRSRAKNPVLTGQPPIRQMLIFIAWKCTEQNVACGK